MHVSVRPQEFMSTSIVDVHDLAQRVGGKWALRGIDFAVGDSELVALTGHNGSGKTTLLRVLATLLRPTRGHVRVLGHDLRHNPDAVRMGVGMLTHEGGQYADLTAQENLEFAQRMLGNRVDRASVAAALEWSGLARVAHLRVRNFSSGMRRRLALAAIRMRDAPVLLMDEPFNSLDRDGGLLIDELLLDTKARGGSAIVVLHDMSRSTLTFDRTIELGDGLVIGDSHRARASLALAR
jgi:heme exporter protein A